MHVCLDTLKGASSPRLPASNAVPETSITPTSATIQWTLLSPYNPAQPEAYLVTYGKDPSNLNMSTSVISTNPTSQTYSIQLSSLQPGTVYLYKIVARNRFESISTDLMFFVTPDESGEFNIYVRN